MKKFYTAALILTLIVIIFSVFGIVSADSMPDYSMSTADNRANCPQDTESMFFMGQDESVCYFQDMESGEIISLDK